MINSEQQNIPLFIDLSLLPEHARAEMYQFYEFPEQKYHMGTQSDILTRKKRFFNSIESYRFMLPENHKFKREELYER